MANITVAEFRARFAEFRDIEKYPDAVIEMYITDSANEVDFSKFEARGPKAQAYWVAHNLTLGEASAAAGAAGATGEAVQRVASESEGDTSVSYAVQSSNGDPIADLWNSTSYGQTYYAMMKYAVAGVTSSGGVVLPMPLFRRPGPFGRGY